jgi:hypothetical protein
MRLVMLGICLSIISASCAVLLRTLSNRAADRRNAQLDDIDWLAEYRIPVVTASGATIRLRVPNPTSEVHLT